MKLKNPFKYVFEAYRFTFGYVYNRIKYFFLKRAGKAPEYKIDITQLPRDEQLKILTEKLLAEKQERVILEQKLKELQEQLDRLRTQAFGKVLEELYREEKETGKLPISIYDLLKKAKTAGILPFRKPPVVFDITMKKLGYLEDIIIHPDGGFSFVIKVGKEKLMTPPFGSIWDAVFHPENLASQLPDTIILCLYKDEQGKLLKVPSHLVNAIYKGEPVEKIIAELQSMINKLASELESTSVNAELISLQNRIEKMNRQVAETVSNVAFNLYEKQFRDLRNILIPTTMAAVEASTAMQLDVAQERSKSEHLKDLIDQYSARIKTLESSLAPERVIAIQQDVIDQLRRITSELSNIVVLLKGMPIQPTGKTGAGKTEEKKGEETGAE